MTESYPFYYRTWFVVFMLFLFFPAGLILMWRGQTFGKTSRIVISAFGLSLLCPFITTIKKQAASKRHNESLEDAG